MGAEQGKSARVRGLIVSSFVLPQVGGVEQFVDVATQLLRRSGWRVRVLACRPPTGEAQADVTVPTRFLGSAGWPLPVGGWRLLWREVGAADVVIANGTRHLLPNVAAFAARLRGKRVLFVLHGSGAPFSTSSFFYHRVLGRLFERLVARPGAAALAAGLAVAGGRPRLSLALRGGGHVRAVPAPRASACGATLGSSRTSRCGSSGSAGSTARRTRSQRSQLVERVRLRRAATLEVYGGGPLLEALEELARERPWLAVRGPRTWEEIQQVQGTAHLCLSTSLRDATQMAVLEPLARGVPGGLDPRRRRARATTNAGCRGFCVEPRRPGGRGGRDRRARRFVRPLPRAVRGQCSRAGAAPSRRSTAPGRGARDWLLAPATVRPAGAAARSSR